MGTFCEFNIEWNPDATLLCESVRTASRLGYDVVFINFELDFDDKKLKIPDGESILLTKSAFERIKEENPRLRQFSRVTCSFTNTLSWQKLRTMKSDLCKFDVVAVNARDECIYKTLADNSALFDVVCLDMSAKFAFRVKQQRLNEMRMRNLLLELQYACALRGEIRPRSSFFQNCLHITRLTRNRGLLLASGCTRALELRGPTDARTLGMMGGMSAESARRALTDIWKDALGHAVARKTGSYAVSIAPSSGLLRNTVDLLLKTSKVSTTFETITDAESLRKKRAMVGLISEQDSTREIKKRKKKL